MMLLSTLCLRLSFIITKTAGDSICIEQLDPNVVAMYMEDMKLKLNEIFIPYKKLCKTTKVSLIYI